MSLGGVNVYILNELATLGNMTIEYHVIRLTDAIYRNGAFDKISVARFLFQELKFDCLWSATLIQPERLLYMNFLMAHQTYGAAEAHAEPRIAE